MKVTTRKEREKSVKDAYAIACLGGNAPSKQVMELAQKYIDGKIETDDISKKIKEMYAAKS